MGSFNNMLHKCFIVALLCSGVVVLWSTRGDRVGRSIREEEVMTSTENEDVSLLNRSFIDPIFLQQFPLTRENALEYFARSPFYDEKSNNETLRMQGTSMSHLKTMTGLEFAVDESVGSAKNATDSRLFVIKKQERSSPSTARVLSVYYILDGTVYQSPNLLHLLMTKYNKITDSLKHALSISTESVKYTNSSMCDSSAGSRRVFPISIANQSSLTDVQTKKRQKISDCHDFPSFNSCVSDMHTFVEKSKEK